MKATAATGAVALALLVAISTLAFIPLPASSLSSPIQHIVVIMQENHSFDNYFGTFPGANGPPTGACMQKSLNDPTQGCVKPYRATSPIPAGPSHYLGNFIQDLDGGANDGWLPGEAENSGTMQYYDSSVIPNYWTYAKNYVLDQAFFSSIGSYSLPSHWYLVSGSAPSTSILNTAFASGPLNTVYFGESDPITTLGDQLSSNGVTWKYYDQVFTSNGFTYFKSNLNTESYTDLYWNPFASQTRSYLANLGHMANRTQIFADLTGGTLPQVSWVIPSLPVSEHPPQNISTGMWWSTMLVNAVMQSQYWSSTAILLTWDDWGGFYDHVAPSTFMGVQEGYRLPMIVISPFAKAGYIDSTPYTFESIISTIESTFSLPMLNARVAGATNMLGDFNFAQPPLGTTIISVSSSETTIVMKGAATDSLIQ